MKSDGKILLAFCLNLLFSVVEFVGGLFTGSVAIISDSIHDFGDAFSIGASYIFERVSLKKPDKHYTYGYYRYSVLGSVIQSAILLGGSVLVIYHAVMRLLHPQPIHYNGMIVLAIVGFAVNFIAAWFTAGGESLNRKAINLHMIEDVLGWAIVLIGAVVMHFTDWAFLDPVLSICLAVFIAFNALKNLKVVLDIFLEKTPGNVDIAEITEHLTHLNGVQSVHHLHIWSMDGYKNAATLHVVTAGDTAQVKKLVKQELAEHGIVHVTVECEAPEEECRESGCEGIPHTDSHHHGHHHGHHHH